MKKIITMLLLVSMVFALAACGAKEQMADATQSTDSPVGVNEQKNTTGQETTAAGIASTDAVDLTALSSTMVYAEVYNMMTNPESYKGRTVTMQGQFAVSEEENQTYYACIIADATACCSQGIEFVLDGDYSYPEDYPEVGSTITVEGTFDWYDEPFGNGVTRYCQLINASMK